MDSKLLHTRLIAFAVGIVVALGVMLGVSSAFPAQDAVDADTDYGCVYSGVKSNSVAFTKAAMNDDSLLMFGSSEFSTPKSLVPQVPAGLFGSGNHGLHPMLIGEAFDQCLWHAMALGAYADGGVPRNKVVLIVGPGWFVDGGMDSDTFMTRFSYSLYAGFNANESIPAETKEYVRQRLESYGVDSTQLNAVSGSLPQDHLNAAAFAVLDDVKMRQGLVDVRSGGIPSTLSEEVTVPDFASIREQALADGEAMSTTNDWGVEDGFYTSRLAPVLADSEGTRGDETYSDTPEYDDFDCFLDIADACGIETLVVISPVMGPYYDYIGITEDKRANCYDHIRDIVAEHDNVDVADFSDREYEKYFLFDIVHFGTLGWTDVNEAVYEFAMGGD